VAAVIAAVALAAAALSGGGQLASSSSLEPPAPRFGDHVAATATVVVGDDVDAASLRAVGGFGPLEIVSGPDVDRREQDGRAEVAFRWVLVCLSEDCVPGEGVRRIALPPLRVTGETTNGSPVATVVRWPRLSVVGRVTPAEAGAASPPLRRETTLPSPTYRASPGAVAATLDVLAAVLLAAAAALGVRGLVRRRRRQAEERLARLTPLERALLYARESERRPPDDRRRALGLLGRVLGGSGSPLGGAASRLAWSPPEPSVAEVETVVDDVERSGAS
jgi:hypothetical protein